MHYGVSYYPEHKAPAELRHDLELLKASGINTVRMGEFAWCRFEPTEGDFHFEWLDPVVEELGAAGIGSIICTPTACPPAWLIEKHPDILYMDNRGVRRPFGGRRHYCYNSEEYRRYSAVIVEKIGERYGKNPYVTGFQIDNEPAQETTGRCCCPTCAEKFREWLREKYGTIGELNRRAGTVFWSQEYNHFGQIRPPVNAIEPGAMQTVPLYYENPTLRLDFERFASESQTAYQEIQSKILHNATGKFVTTNATGLATNSIDYYESSRGLDLYTFDLYPGMRDAKIDSFPYAHARGVKGGKHYGVMEFNSGGGHRFGGSGRQQPNPGALKQSVAQILAHGADLMLHFQFRTYPFGAEQLNYAIVDMDGVPRRRYREMQETATLMKQLRPYQNAAFDNKIAICMSYDAHWALRIKPVNDPEFLYIDYLASLYRMLGENGVGADVIPLEGDISAYKVLLLPACFILAPEQRERLKAFVRGGGTLLATFLTGVKNRDNVGYTDSLPAGLTDLFGVTVAEVEPVQERNHAPLALNIGGKTSETTDRYWSELLEATGGAELPGVYIGSYKKGAGVVSRNRYGEGTAWYLGTGLPDDAMKALLGSICDEAAIPRHPFACSDKVEVVRRVQDGREIFFVFNFTAGETAVRFPGVMRDLLSGETYAASLSMRANGFALLAAQP